MNISELIKGIEALEKEKGISKESVIEAIEQALVNAYQKEQRNINRDAVVRVKIDLETGKIDMWTTKTVVDEVDEGCESFEISFSDAKKINETCELGDEIEVPFYIPIADLSRMAAQHARQILRQKIREAEKQMIYEAFSDKIGEIVNGVVDRVEGRFILVNLGSTIAYLPERNTIPGEKFNPGDPIKVYISTVDNGRLSSQVEVSRTDIGFVRKLFEQEIHEIYSGSIEIVKIVREPGARAKVAVRTNNKDIDAPASCIGPRGSRIINITRELQGERIDVFNYYDDAAMFIIEAMKPANVVGINLDKENKKALVVVADDDLSAAIGRSGQNVRLATKITEWNLDIKSRKVALEEQLEYVDSILIQDRYNLDQLSKDYIKPQYTGLDVSLKDGDDYEEIIDDSEDIIIEPTETVNVEKATEPVYEFVEVKIAQNTKTLSELEAEIENSRQQQQAQQTSNRRKKREEKEDEKRIIDDEALKKEQEARNYMPIYTEEELKEFEEEVEEQTYDYDDYDYEDYES